MSVEAVQLNYLAERLRVSAIEITKLRQIIARRSSHQDLALDEANRRNGRLEKIIRDAASALDDSRHAAQGSHPLARKMIERIDGA